MKLRLFVSLAVATILAASGVPAGAATNLSKWVFPGVSGRLLHQPDALGNRILDYTSVGYKGGRGPLPVVPVKVTISPVAGDDRASIQAAIDSVEAMPVDTNGFRGAVLLTAGEYQVNGTLTINSSGVVLRGVGSGTNGTVLRATATNQHTLIRITGSGSASSSTTHNLTDYYLPVGARSFNVDSTSGFAVGDRVFVRRIATSNWISEIGMDLLGPPGDPDASPWTASGYHIDFDRVITRLEGNRVFINAPITTAIEARHAGGTVRKYTWTSRINNCAVEHLRGVSNFAGVDDEDHGWILVQLNSVENAWVRDVTSQYFGYACVALYSGTRFTTVRDCRSLDPVSVITGGRRYAFVLDDSSLCLLENCYTDEDRHQFVTQSLTTGPNVFVDGLNDSAKSDCGPHHRWGTGALWDNVTVNGNALNIQNRGNLGSGHGWAGANEVAYNCYASSGYVVQKPPGAHNWLIGSIGQIKNGTVYVGPHDAGDYDSSGSSATNVFPNSLYYAQLQDRLAAPNLQTREYWLGQINSFTNSSAPGESVPVDSAWLAAVISMAGGAAVNGFDVVANNQWVPFTFNYSLSVTDQIVAATLTLAIRAASGASSDDVLFLDSTNNVFPLAGLGWTPVSTSVTNPSVKVLDLSSQLGLLADGKLNIALKNDVGVDWALLELQVAPALAGGTNVIYPVADATVRGGASANSNFGPATTLTIKEDTSNDNDRKAWLRWDLTSVTGTVYQARLRLTPVSVGTDGIEQGVAFGTNDAWSEASVTWNNQPFAGKRFATWIPGTNGPLEVVVTPQVQEALAGDKQISVQLYSIRNFGANGVVDYASREHADVNLRPQLRLFMAGAPPTVSDIGNQSTGVNVATGPLPFTIGDGATPAANLVVSGASSNTNLVPNANIIFGGSASNRTVTVTPAPNQSGIATITVTVTDGDGLSASDAFSLTVGNHSPGIMVWNGPGAGANNWSNGGNWSPAGPPEALDDVKFFDIGASGVTVSNINNVVDLTFGGTIGSLHIGNTNGNHTALISPGKTLNITGATGLTVGTETDNGSIQQVNTTLTGPNGALNLNGGSLIVRQATDPSSSSQRATLDLSGLDIFGASVNRVLVGTEGNFARPTGTLLLAKTNAITANGSAPAIAIGGAGGGSGNAGGISHILLGKANMILADSIAVGRVKQGLSGGLASSLRFNPSFTNANPALGPTAVLRGVDGVSRIASWNVADAQSPGGTVNTAGACDFTGGLVDAMVDTMIVARSSTGSGAGFPVGSFTLHAGTVNVNTLQVGVQGSASANGGLNSATGTVNVNGGLLTVNSSLQLGPTAGGAGAATNRGIITITGGSARLSSISAGAGLGNTVAISGGSLFLTNSAGPGISLLALTNAALHLRVTTNTTSFVVTNLVTDGAGNVVHIFSMPPIASNPTQFPLIKYSGAVGGAGFNLTLGTLPGALVCGGYLSNNIANSSVDLVLTNCATPDSFLTWNGDVNADWDTATLNWKNNLGPGLAFASGNAVVFDDAASGETNVNLVGALIPASVLVSNAAKPYLFGGLGELSGGLALTKRGPGTLALANSGNNDFSGGVFIEAGTLQVGNDGGDGNLPGGAVNNNAALVFDLTDDLTVSSVISGAGSLVQKGPNVLTLSGASTFTGPLTIRDGTLRVGHAAALGAATGATIITNSGVLDVNGFNLTAEPITVSGSGVTNSGALLNRGVAQTSALRNVTLAGDTTFGGTSRWDIRAASSSSTNGCSLVAGGQPFKITKVGPNQVSLVAVHVDPALGDIDVREGTFAIQTVTSQLGNPIRALTVFPGATLNLWNLNAAPLNKRIVLSNTATVWNESGNSIIVGPVTLTNGNAIFNVGGTSLTLSNSAISGTGGLTKTGAGTLVLHGMNTFTGNTTVSAGLLALVGAGALNSSASISVSDGATLDVGGRSDGKLTLNGGQTLTGNGTILGSVQSGPGATISPGFSVGALTVSNAVTLFGTTFMELNKTANTNDSIRGAASISFGGTLSMTNVSGTLSATDSFKLFAALSYSGQFTSLKPAIPALNLGWNTNTLATDGILRVANVPTPPPVINHIGVTGNDLILTVANGVPDWPCVVQSSTNIALPLTQWSGLATNWFDDVGQFRFTNQFNPAEPQRYLRVQLL